MLSNLRSHIGLFNMLRIYLSGSIQKGEEDPRSSDYFWTIEHEQNLISKIKAPVSLLNPAKTPIRRNNFYVNYGCDLYLVKSSHIIVADLRKSKGIGVGAELMFANLHNIPVIGWLPPQSDYKREVVRNLNGEDLFDWVHPFAYGMCDKHLNSLDEIGDEINRMISSSDFGKSYRTPDHSIETFLREYPDLENK